MENPNTNTSACGVMDGKLPGSCASMAFPYIPTQANSDNRYTQEQALAAGTLFPGLNLPFFKAVKSKMNCTNTALCELMALGFAVNELGLYLDTHKDDKAALALYVDYVKLAKEGMARYEAQYGPLQQSNVSAEAYTWVNDPWPWDFADGGKI